MEMIVIMMMMLLYDDAVVVVLLYWVGLITWFVNSTAKSKMTFYDRTPPRS